MNWYRYRLVCLLALFASLGALMAGCGDGRPKRVPVSGQVLLDGKPLAEGSFVTVVPEKARPATGRVGPDGRFTLTTYEDNDGCVLGTHPVEVVCYDTSKPTTFQSLIPDKYHDAETSGITVTIDKPTDSLTINLSSEGERTKRRSINVGDSDPTKL